MSKERDADLENLATDLHCAVDCIRGNVGYRERSWKAVDELMRLAIHARDERDMALHALHIAQEPQATDRDADLDALGTLDVVSLPPGVRIMDVLKQRDEAIRLAKEARDKQTTEYVRGWNDGEVDAESLRKRAESAEAELSTLRNAVEELLNWDRRACC